MFFNFSLARTDVSQDYSQEAWRKLEESINAIHSSKAISYSLEELYLAVENSCSHGMAPILYENLKRECQKHMSTQLDEFNQLVNQATPPTDLQIMHHLGII